MRRTLLPVVALTTCTVAQMYFNDPTRTPTDCIVWHDIGNATDQSCEDVLHYWNLEPVRFHNWNPSVGLDCTPWHDRRSYCVLTNTTVWDSINGTTSTLTIDNTHPYTVTFPVFTTDSAGWTIPATRTDAPARTTRTRAPVPSPALWTDKGCFIDTWNDDYDIPVAEWNWILDFRFAPKEANETLASCKQKCWEMAWPVAGVKGGNECFCGDRNNGTLAGDQGECNVPCEGDAGVICGGVNRTTVWEAEEYIASTAAAAAAGSATVGEGVGEGDGSASRTGGSAATATASSGAARNAGMFWRW